MFRTRPILLAIAAVAVLVGAGFPNAWARDIRINFPRHSELTPVQKLNREGVDAVRKHQYEKAQGLFYKAYLYDAADPFTLNNLGYISELEGNLDRAQQFYALASEQDCDARIDVSNTKQLEGKPMTAALGDLKDTPMRVNHMNVQAVELLSQGRDFEADNLLKQALALDPRNPFTVNNLGVAEEARGNFDDALKYYDQAADSQSSEPVVVTLKQSWRGRPVSKMAAASAQQLRKRMQEGSTAEARATMFNVRGVSAINRNDWPDAKQAFLQAYSSDPNSAFSLNNMGYLAEKSGDIETAQFYYSKARRADGANARVGLATDSSAEGKPLAAVAGESTLSVNKQLDLYRQAARRQTGPIELIPRGNSPAQPNVSPNPSSNPPSSPAPRNPESQAPKPQ